MEKYHIIGENCIRLKRDEKGSITSGEHPLKIAACQPIVVKRSVFQRNERVDMAFISQLNCMSCLQ